MEEQHVFITEMTVVANPYTAEHARYHIRCFVFITPPVLCEIGAVIISTSSTRKLSLLVRLREVEDLPSITQKKVAERRFDLGQSGSRV